MMSNAIAKTNTDTTPAALLEKVVVGGDLGKLSPGERMNYYKSVCESVGLNPLTRPFDYLVLQGKTTLYARKDATDQLRNLRGVSVRIVSRERVEDVWIVTAEATTADGRTDASIGAVSIGGLKADALANALMKAETKAKRRVTLSICGLGMLDESEIETIQDARAELDAATGEVLTDAEVARNEARKALIKRCRDAAITLGKDRLRPIAKGRTPESLNDADLTAMADALEAAVEAMIDETDTADYTPGEEG